MRLKRWGIALAMALALGCGEEKGSMGGGDARDIGRGDLPNATQAVSKAGERDAESGAQKSNCQEEAENLCKWRSGQSSTAYTQKQLEECVARVSAKCKEDGQ